SGNAKSQSKFDWLFLVERSIELSNLDDISDMSRRSLIWEGLEELDRLELRYLETFKVFDKKIN
ncbi:MAG: hypothetical protein ACKO5W_09210, partial [Crocinitomicaceae bacterium]